MFSYPLITFLERYFEKAGRMAIENGKGLGGLLNPKLPEIPLEDKMRSIRSDIKILRKNPQMSGSASQLFLALKHYQKGFLALTKGERHEALSRALETFNKVPLTLVLWPDASIKQTSKANINSASYLFERACESGLAAVVAACDNKSKRAHIEFNTMKSLLGHAARAEMVVRLEYKILKDLIQSDH